MKNDLAYWEKNKEHLQKHFLDWEEFVAAVKLRTRIPWVVFGFLGLFLLAFAALLLWSPLMKSEIVIIIISLVFTGVVLSVLEQFLAWGANHKWMVLTTRGFYICMGKECELVFDRSFSSIEAISYCYTPQRLLLNVYSDELPAKAESTYRGLPWKGEKAYILNRFRKLAGLPLERKLFSLSVISALTTDKSYRQQFCFYPLDLPKDSEAAKKFRDLLNGFPRIRRIELNGRPVNLFDKL